MRSLHVFGARWIKPRNGFVGLAGDAALHVYAEVLYHTCSGTAGRERQQLAYGELLRYLYDASFASRLSFPATSARRSCTRLLQSWPSGWQRCQMHTGSARYAARGLFWLSPRSNYGTSCDDGGAYASSPTRMRSRRSRPVRMMIRPSALYSMSWSYACNSASLRHCSAIRGQGSN